MIPCNVIVLTRNVMLRIFTFIHKIVKLTIMSDFSRLITAHNVKVYPLRLDWKEDEDWKVF